MTSKLRKTHCIAEHPRALKAIYFLTTEGKNPMKASVRMKRVKRPIVRNVDRNPA
jgi:hypothetical protein